MNAKGGEYQTEKPISEERTNTTVSSDSIYRVLIFSPYAYPLSGPESLVADKFLVTLHNDGIVFKALTWASGESVYKASQDIGKKIQKYILPIRTISIRKYLAPLKHCLNIDVLDNMVGGVFWSIKAKIIASRELKKEKYDIIFSRCTPFWGHLPALLIFRQKTPWIALWNDPPFLRMLPKPYGSGKEANIRCWRRWYLRKIVLNADWHIFPSERLKNYMTKSFMQDFGPFNASIIPHIALKLPLEKENMSSNVFSICHAGTLDEHRNPISFLEGLNLFRKRNHNPNLKVLFFGRQNKYSRLFHEYGIEFSEQTLTYRDSINRLANFTVLLVIEAPCDEGVFFPSKFVDYVQTGRPILAISPKNGTLNDILSKWGGGLAADVSSPQSIAEALNTLYEKWRQKRIDIEYSSEKLYEFYGEKAVTGSLKELFFRLKTIRH